METETIKEIAKTLRSTEKMAAAFVQSVQTKIGQDVSEKLILGAMQKLNPRSLEISRVVTAVKQEMTKEKRRANRQSRRKTVISISTSKGRTTRSTTNQEKKVRRKSSASSVPSKPVIEQIEDTLNANWRRATKEGFDPEKMSGPAFIQAVHRYCDRRDASKARILRACKSVDARDVVITPTAVADIIREQN